MTELAVIRKTLEVLFHPQKDIHQNLSRAELLGIVLREEYQGEGISKLLSSALGFEKVPYNSLS